MPRALLFLLALAAIAGLAFAAACTGTNSPWLDTDYTAYCDDMTVNATCFAVISENTSGLNVETLREWKSPNAWVASPQPFISDDAGRLAYSFPLSKDRFFEGSVYDVRTYCGNSSASLQFTQAGLAPPAYVTSYMLWGSANMPYLVIFGIFLFCALLAFGIFAGLFWAMFRGR